MENIVLNFDKNTGGSSLDLDFTDLSNVNATTANIEINKTSNVPEIKNFSESKPNLTMNANKSVSIGLDLLANPNKVKADSIGSVKNSTSDVTVIKSPTTSSDPLSEIKLNTTDTSKIEEIKLDGTAIKEINLDGVKLSGDLSSTETKPTVNSFDFSSLPSAGQSTPNPTPVTLTPEQKAEAERKKFEDIQKEKFELLCLFERLNKKGIHTIKKFTMNSDIDEMRYEYNRIKKQREIEGSVKFQRKMLMACVTGIEFLNSKFDPFDIKLDGWSESIHENLNDYDEVFEELYEKYNSKTKIAPELKLMFMVGGSAFMFHLTNTMFKSSLPGMSDIMKQNPELMQQFAKAAMSSMTGNNNQTSNNVENILNNENKQRDMEGPPDIDSILSQISEEKTENPLKTINLGGGRNTSGITLDL